MLAVMLFSASSFSQVMSQESSQVLNDQKKAIENSMEVNDKKIKLSEKQKELAEKRTEMEQNALKAQASADLNTQVAGQLTANPQDKKLLNGLPMLQRMPNVMQKMPARPRIALKS